LKWPEGVSAVHDDVGEGSGRSEEGRAASALGVRAQGVEELGTGVTPGEVAGALVESSLERTPARESETEGGGRNLPEAGEMSEDEMDTPARTERRALPLGVGEIRETLDEPTPFSGGEGRDVHTLFYQSGGKEEGGSDTMKMNAKEIL
jgi:hypothetical protein